MKTCPHCTSGYSDSLTTCPTHGAILNEIRDLKPGLVLRSTYKIIRKLGQGAMGSVYLADQMLMDEQRALKFLAPELAGDESFTSRFLREVKTLRKVRHVNVIDCGDLERAEDESLFFAMEFVDGPDLRHLITMARGPMPVSMALDITRGIATGLAAAHHQGLVHRDIKPENILMAGKGDPWTPKIADFGIVATKEASGRSRTRTGATLLTMAYAAPEQWRGMKSTDYDGRTDLYALGGVLFEMLTGRNVFDADNYEGWSREHLTTAPQPPSRFNPEVAKWRGLDQLTLQLLAKERENRFQDVHALLTALSQCTPGHAETVVDARVTPPPPSPTPSIPPVQQGSMPQPPHGSMPQQPYGAIPQQAHGSMPQPPYGSVPPNQYVSYQSGYQPPSRGMSGGKIVGLILGILALLLVCFLVLCVIAANGGFTPEPVKDKSYYLKQGNTYAQQQQFSSAAQAYETACGMGEGSACDTLGVYYYKGKGVTQDMDRAHSLLQSGCTLGNENACKNLKNLDDQLEAARKQAAEEAAKLAEQNSIITEVGVDPTTLTDRQKEVFVGNLKQLQCPCGCNESVLVCFRTHLTCPNRLENIQQVLKQSTE